MMTTRNQNEFAQVNNFDILSPLSILLATFLLHYVGAYIYVLFRYMQGDYIPLGLDWRHLNAALGFGALFVAIWWVGYGAGVRWAKRRPPTFQLAGKPAPIFLLTIAFAALAAVVYVLSTRASGSLIGLRSNLTQGSSGKLLFATIAFATVFHILLMERVSTIIKSSSTMIAFAWTIFLVLTCAILYLSLIGLGGRLRALVPFVSLITIYHYRVRRISAVMGGIIFSCLIVIAFVLHQRLSGASHVDSNIFTVLFGIERGRNFDSIYNIANLFRYQETHPDILNGTGAINGVLRDVGLAFGDSTREAFMKNVYRFRDVLVGFTLGKPGELYYNFGPASLALAAPLGAICGSLYHYIIKCRIFGPASTSVYVILFLVVGISTINQYLFEILVNGAFHLTILMILLVTMAGGYRWILWDREPAPVKLVLRSGTQN